MTQLIPPLSDILVRLEDALYSINPLICQKLHPGLPVADIKKIFNSIKIEAPEDLITLYSWHNGTAYEAIPSGLIKFCPEGTFMPLNDIIIDYTDAVWDEDPLYNKCYFPITNSDALLYNINICDGVYLYSPSLLIIEPLKIYDSLSSYFYTILTAINCKIIKYGTDGYFLVDYQAFNILASEINLAYKNK